MSTLFTSYNLSGLSLKNRIVMSPMTRSRAIGNVPNDMMAVYYAQRAEAGLIITEGTSPSKNGLGYARIPGIYSEAQIAAWKTVTDAVHEKNGKIFIQLMHTGRVTHSDNLPEGGKVLGPSPVKLESTKMWVDAKGMLDLPAPEEMSPEEVKEAISEYIEASKNAIRAGFDGVEIHGANGYLIKQFLNPHVNKRTDLYGGGFENRSRFLLEVAEGIAKAIGAEKLGLRLSPYSVFNETPQYPEAEATYLYLAEKLNKLNIGYLHITDPSVKGEPHDLAKRIRAVFKNTIIASGGYDPSKAEDVLKNGVADLVAFGRPFISNPDLVSRFKNNLPLNQAKFDLFYTAGEEGYIDYPVFEDVKVIA